MKLMVLNRLASQPSAAYPRLTLMQMAHHHGPLGLGWGLQISSHAFPTCKSLLSVTLTSSPGMSSSWLGAGDIAHLVEYLPRMHEAPGSVTSTS